MKEKIYRAKQGKKKIRKNLDKAPKFSILGPQNLALGGGGGTGFTSAHPSLWVYSTGVSLSMLLMSLLMLSLLTLFTMLC